MRFFGLNAHIPLVFVYTFLWLTLLLCVLCIYEPQKRKSLLFYR